MTTLVKCIIYCISKDDPGVKMWLHFSPLLLDTGRYLCFCTISRQLGLLFWSCEFVEGESTGV